MAVAAYMRIAEDLRGKINSHEIKPGEQLPSELELRSQYSASRNTVLDAVKLLRDEGLVETRPGQGWFARIRIVPFDNAIDWADHVAIAEARARGRSPRSTPPTVTRQPAPPEVADRLRVPAGTEMILRRQEWLLDEIPWKLQAVWCQKSYSDAGGHRLLMAEDIAEGLGAYLQHTLGLGPASTACYLLPRKPTSEEISFFGFTDESDIPCVIELIRTVSVQRDDESQPLYVAIGVYAADRNRFVG